jgi:hypothetical protein
MWAYSETNRRGGSKRRVGRPGGTSAEAQPGRAYPLIGISRRVVDVRRDRGRLQCPVRLCRDTNQYRGTGL